jgi:hypothetical protein
VGFGDAGFFALVAGGEAGGFRATGVLASAISAVDGSLRAFDHESTSFRNCTFMASVCLSASRCPSSSGPSAGFVIIIVSLVLEENHKFEQTSDKAQVHPSCRMQPDRSIEKQ